MLFIFHAKLKRGIPTYVSIKQRKNFVIKTDEISCQISATVFTLVCLQKCSLIPVIAECHYVNLLIFHTILGSLLCSSHI